MGRPSNTDTVNIDPRDNLFKRIRLFARLSQDNLAHTIGVAVSTVRRWEKRHNTIEPSFTVMQFKHFCKIAGYEIIRELPDTLVNEKNKD